jgi:hypothetical protein
MVQVVIAHMKVLFQELAAVVVRLQQDSFSGKSCDGRSLEVCRLFVGLVVEDWGMEMRLAEQEVEDSSSAVVEKLGEVVDRTVHDLEAWLMAAVRNAAAEELVLIS